MGKYEDFFKLALNDIKVARVVLDSANDELMQNSAAYNVEQAIEKGLKGLIAKSGNIAGISHNISALCNDLDDLKIFYPQWIRDNDDTITSWATTIRYNASFKTDHDEIKQMIELAQEWLVQLNCDCEDEEHGDKEEVQQKEECSR